MKSLMSLSKNRVYLYFVRHAEADFSVQENIIRPLTARGAKDTLKVTAALRNKDIDGIYSSPLIRSAHTVWDLAHKLQLQIKLINDLREREVGDYWVEDFQSYARRQWEDFSFKNSGGESLEEVQARNIDAVKKIVNENLGRNIVIATHGTALSTILNYYQPSYGYEDFLKIVDRTPYIVRFVMDDGLLLETNEVEL